MSCGLQLTMVMIRKVINPRLVFWLFCRQDLSFQISDEEALPICFDLLKEEGLCLGGSSGINVAGAIRLAKEIGPGKTIVTILCDSGVRYQTKLFNPEYLRKKNLPVPEWLE